LIKKEKDGNKSPSTNMDFFRRKMRDMIQIICCHGTMWYLSAPSSVTGTKYGGIQCPPSVFPVGDDQ